jgi:hypothetical protein
MKISHAEMTKQFQALGKDSGSGLRFVRFSIVAASVLFEDGEGEFTGGRILLHLEPDSITSSTNGRIANAGDLSQLLPACSYSQAT